MGLLVVVGIVVSGGSFLMAEEVTSLFKLTVFRWLAARGK